MTKESTGHDFAVLLRTWSRGALGSRCVRLGLVAAAGVSLALSGPEQPLAQQRYHEAPVTVTGVSSSGNVVSISADGSLNRAQTWQDAEGFHVVLVNGQASGSTRGVRVQRVGNSLELVVPVKRGANVTVQPRGNRLDLVVSGGALNVENFPVEQQPKSVRAPGRTQSAPREETSGEVSERAQQPKAESKRRAAAESSTVEPTQAEPQPASVKSSTPAPPVETQERTYAEPISPVNSAPPAPTERMYAEAVNLAPPSPPASTVAQPAEVKLENVKGEGLLSYLLSLPSLFAVVGIGVAGSVGMFIRRRRAGVVDESDEVETKQSRAAEKAKPFEHSKGDRRRSDITVPFERRKSGRGAEDEATRRGNELAAEANGPKQERSSESKSSAAVPSVLYGSYRIDQEVASLVVGGAHSVEILASRASDDRRAVETSLLKALRAPGADEEGRRRARIALEDYGFVARACAALLLGGETFERVSAARALSDMKSAQALPFLTEALYDADPLVRNECVQSIGALGMPSAIGALLDAARRHQDIPATVLRPALTACSVESLEVDWNAPAFARTQLDSYESDAAGSDVRALVPTADYEELPESCDDETLSAALVRIESTDAESRVNAAQLLAQFQVRSAVEALATAARHDAEDAVRSAAVNSLGIINHESVFAHIIMALADEAREVRAAAARALSRLSFERAEAYVRVAETADLRTLCDVAHACVKAGLAAQAVGRLTSEDRRQAYEAFSLLSLCVSGGEVGPVLDAIGSHRDDEASMTCVQLLGDSLTPPVSERLRDLAAEAGMPERVRRSILETIGRAQALEAV